MKKLVSILAFLFILSGCSTTVFFTRNVPPEIAPEKRPARILFVNKFDYKSSPAVREKHDTAYQTGINEFANALISNSLKGASAIFFLGDSISSRYGLGQFSNSLIPEETISTVCRSNDADLILVLDSLYLGFDWETFTTKDDDGSKSKTKNIYLHGNYYVSLYKSEGSIYKCTALEKSLFYTSRPTLSGLITFVPNLARCGEKIKELANEAGSQYIGMFYPGTVNEVRTLYAGKIFAESNTSIMDLQFNKAVTLLEKIADSPKKSLAKRARHNITVANELSKSGAKPSQFMPFPFMKLNR